MPSAWYHGPLQCYNRSSRGSKGTTGAPRRLSSGRRQATPSQTFPVGRACRPIGGSMGKPGFPVSRPLVGAADAPTGGDVGKPGFPMSRPLVGAAATPTDRGMGKPGCPVSRPLVGAAGAPTGRGMGKPGCPMSRPLVGAAGAPTGGGAVRQAHRRWGNRVSPYVHISVSSRAMYPSSTAKARCTGSGKARSTPAWRRMSRG